MATAGKVTKLALVHRVLEPLVTMLRQDSFVGIERKSYFASPPPPIANDAAFLKPSSSSYLRETNPEFNRARQATLELAYSIFVFEARDSDHTE